jgi:hypothetical protein
VRSVHGRWRPWQGARGSRGAGRRRARAEGADARRAAMEGRGVRGWGRAQLGVGVGGRALEMEGGERRSGWRRRGMRVGESRSAERSAQGISIACQNISRAAAGKSEQGRRGIRVGGDIFSF